MATLSQEERDVLKAFEEGRLVREVTQCPGWQLILDMLESRVKKAEFHLMNCDSADPLMIGALHRRARAFRELFQDIQLDVTRSISAERDAVAAANQSTDEF